MATSSVTEARPSATIAQHSDKAQRPARQAPAAQPPEHPQVSQPKPFTNPQGQSTGRVLNVSA